MLADHAEIEHALAGLTPEQRDRVKQRTKGWLEKVLPSGLLKEKFPNKVKWRLLGAYCPFLENGQCVVYQDRPFLCRTHNAVRSPEYCFDEALRQNQRFATSPDADDNLRRYMLTCLAESGEPMESDNLGVLLAEILLHRSVRSATRRRVARDKVRALLASPAAGMPAE